MPPWREMQSRRLARTSSTALMLVAMGSACTPRQRPFPAPADIPPVEIPPDDVLPRRHADRPHLLESPPDLAAGRFALISDGTVLYRSPSPDSPSHVFRDDETRTLAVLGSALVVGALSYGASLLLYIAGAQHLGATRSQLVFSTAPLWGLALAWLVLREDMTIAQLAAVALMGAPIWLWYREHHSHLDTRMHA